MGRGTPPKKRAADGVKVTTAKKSRMEALERKLASKSPSGGRAEDKRSSIAARLRSQDKKASARVNFAPEAFYKKLSNEILEGPVGKGLGLLKTAAPRDASRLTGIEGIVQDIAETNARAASQPPEKVISVIKDELPAMARVYLDRPCLRRSRAKKDQKPGMLMSNTALKKAGLGLQPSELSTRAVNQLGEMWKEYAKVLLNEDSTPEHITRLAERDLDLHGCDLKVVQSKNPMNVMKGGIVIKESSTAFHIAALAVDAEPYALARVHVNPKSISKVSFVWPSENGPSRLITMNGSDRKYG